MRAATTPGKSDVSGMDEVTARTLPVSAEWLDIIAETEAESRCAPCRAW